jgi:hypothetical protein
VAGPRTPAASVGPATRAKRNGNTCGRKSVQSRGKGDLPGPTVTHRCPSMRVWTQGSRLDAGILPVPGSSPASLSDRSLGRRPRRQMPGSAPRGAPGSGRECFGATGPSSRRDVCSTPVHGGAPYPTLEACSGRTLKRRTTTVGTRRKTSRERGGEEEEETGRHRAPSTDTLDWSLLGPPTDRQPRTTETTDRTVTGAVVRERRNVLDGPCGTWNPFTRLSGPATSSRRPGASSTRSGPGAWSETSVRV